MSHRDRLMASLGAFLASSFASWRSIWVEVDRQESTGTPRGEHEQNRTARTNHGKLPLVTIVRQQ